MRSCIVIPVYNHGEPLKATVENLQRFELPIVIVDDGSDENTRASIDEVVARHGATLVRLPRNTGKGGAVMSGLRAAARAGFTHALQIDADGQHDTDDVPKLLKAAGENPSALIAGVPTYDDSIPASRLHGRRITSFWVAIETLSLEMPDTMCGFRVYPLDSTLRLIESNRLGTGMDFDIDIAVRMSWSGVEIVGVPTRVIYPEGGLSNFRLLRDNWSISKRHARLFFGMLLRLPMLLARRVGLRRAHWSDIQERGTVLGMRLLFVTYRVFGRWLFAAFLYPVIGYFYLTDARARQVSRSYLDRVARRREKLGLPRAGRLSSFRHLLAFGHAVLDKGAMWAGSFPVERIEFADPSAFARFRSENRGSMFIGSHLGNLEVLRAFGESVQGMTVNALVFTRHSARFNRMLEAISPAAARNMMQVDSLGPESVAVLEDRLDRGEHVAIVADRTSTRHRERSVYVDFLGEPAPFPEGPFVLAHLLECPVYLLFCVKEHDMYRIYLEPFAHPLKLPRKEREAALRDAVQRYVGRLEHHCLHAPLQWFNFFDFWNQAGEARRAG